MSFATAETPSGLLGRQRPRIELLPSVDVTSTGEMALEVCERAGLFLDPWQRFVLTHSLGEREDGKWAAFEVGEVIPRQNGKGSTLEGRELTGLFASTRSVSSSTRRMSRQRRLSISAGCSN
jgi:hypothetical protein